MSSQLCYNSLSNANMRGARNTNACSNQRKDIFRMAILKYTPKDIQRFWSKIAITANPDKCWEWQSSKNDQDYGRFLFNRKSRAAHRIAWELTYGEIPDGLSVLHKCDNRKCCNPAHLFLGTHLDNMRDMVQKGRHVPCLGERHGMHKLTAEKVRYIRKRYAQGGILQRELADEMGVSRSTIGKAIHRQLYGSVNDE